MNDGLPTRISWALRLAGAGTICVVCFEAWKLGVAAAGVALTYYCAGVLDGTAMNRRNRERIDREIGP